MRSIIQPLLRNQLFFVKNVQIFTKSYNVNFDEVEAFHKSLITHKIENYAEIRILLNILILYFLNSFIFLENLDFKIMKIV